MDSKLSANTSMTVLFEVHFSVADLQSPDYEAKDR